MSQNTFAGPKHSRPVFRMHETPLTPKLLRSGSTRMPGTGSFGLSEFTHVW